LVFTGVGWFFLSKRAFDPSFDTKILSLSSPGATLSSFIVFFLVRDFFFQVQEPLGLV
jgi:hypothetical protein